MGYGKAMHYGSGSSSVLMLARVQCIMGIHVHKCYSSPSESKGWVGRRGGVGGGWGCVCVPPGTHVGEVDICAAAAAGKVAGELVQRAAAPLPCLAEVGAALSPPSLLRHW